MMLLLLFCLEGAIGKDEVRKKRKKSEIGKKGQMGIAMEMSDVSWFFTEGCGLIKWAKKDI